MSVRELEMPEVDTLPPTAPGVWTNPLMSYVNGLYQVAQQRRSSLGLPNPGLLENVNKEVAKDVFLTPYFFTGLRADVSKSFSLTPAFQVSHSLSLGSAVLPPYSFAAAFATDKTLLQGSIESDFSLSGRAHHTWSESNISKAQMQMGDSQSIIHLEHDYLGSDHSINLKAMNPSLLDGGLKGFFSASLLQSLTPHLSLGVEAVYSDVGGAAAFAPPQAAIMYTGRYATPNWIASAQLQPSGTIKASFWRKVADKVEAGIETSLGYNQQAMMLGAPPALEGETTVGAKYEFRQSVFRGQIDSNGKVSCLVERRVLPIVSVTFAGEIDQFKSEARLGLGLQLEAGSEEVFEQQQQMMLAEQGAPAA